MRVPAVVRQALQQLIRDLVRGDFERLEADRRAGELTADEIRQAIDEYGCTLIEVPESALDEARAYGIRSRRDTYAIDVPLWTAEEHGRSDLTLSVRALVGDGRVRLEIANIHVL